MAGRDWRMGSEHTLLTDGLHIVVGEGGPTGALGLLVQQFQGQQAGMPLIQMKAGEGCIAERPQHTYPTDPEQDFLAQPIMGIAAIQDIGQRAVPGRIVRQISIQKIHRYGAATDATHRVVPGAEVHGPPFDGDSSSRRHFMHKVIDGPGRRLLVLPATLIQALVKIPLAVQERYCHHGYFEVGRGANRIARQDAQSAAVCGHAHLQTDLHGKICNGAAGYHRASLHRLRRTQVFNAYPRPTI